MCLFVMQRQCYIINWSDFTRSKCKYIESFLLFFLFQAPTMNNWTAILERRKKKNNFCRQTRNEKLILSAQYYSNIVRNGPIKNVRLLFFTFLPFGWLENFPNEIAIKTIELKFRPEKKQKKSMKLFSNSIAHLKPSSFEENAVPKGKKFN